MKIEPSVVLASIPEHLRERVRIVDGAPRRDWKDAREGLDVPDRSPVVYWTHHALRVDENPALDVAQGIAVALQRPLLVYQGLASSYRYASDRHHVFQLQGAKDLARDYGALGIRYALFVETREDRSAALLELCKQTDWLITEDFPGEPTDRWLQRLTHLKHLNVIAVDTACVVPMQLVGKAYDRAFAFRDATSKLYRERIGRQWPQVGVPAVAYRGPLPFAEVDVAAMEPMDLVAKCDIDATVAPVGDTLGGSRAGYARWQGFLEKGIRKYAARRNDPCGGVSSRMSAYLHYGMVSPMRLAREANALGAEKYLDELLIWRELAYGYCFYRKDYDAYSTLPAWAQETMRQHSRDPREAIYSWETLARGKTSDALWNACQRSLLKHGELHNNVRMTWGKAVAMWTRSGEEALGMLIDLNHRFALDGRDPASYGGILWCLGQFDRPFYPEQPVLGTVRGRSTREHLQRLDLQQFEAHVDRPVGKPPRRVAIVGAGVAGTFCARTLADYGCDVTLFDKSRGVGGRMATRRLADGQVVDHGPALMQWNGDQFGRWFRSWEADGIVQKWDAKVARWDGRSDLDLAAQSVEECMANETSGRIEGVFVGGRGMSDLAKHFAQDARLVLQTQVQSLRHDGGEWYVQCERESSSGKTHEELGPYDAVVMNVPPVQCKGILGVTRWEKFALGEDVECWMEPVWAMVLGFQERWGIPVDGVLFDGHTVLDWMGRETSKPGRFGDGGGLQGKGEYWVVHSRGSWAREHLECSTEEVTQKLLATLKGLGCVGMPEVSFVQVHRWRYARVDRSVRRVQRSAKQYWWDSSVRLGVCGDWLSSSENGIQGALESGASMAGCLLRDWIGQERDTGKMITPMLF